MLVLGENIQSLVFTNYILSLNVFNDQGYNFGKYWILFWFMMFGVSLLEVNWSEITVVCFAFSL